MQEAEAEFPETMPDGQPVAQPQPMPQQMPEQGMGPMAQYGMSMGGYDMPFAQDGFVVLKPDGTPFNSDPNYVAPSIPYLPEDIQPYYNLINAPQNELQSISQAELDAWNAANPPEQVEAITPQQRYGGIPRAEYGMPMGTGMSQNYMGRRRRMYAYGGNLPIAQDGTPRPKETRPVSAEDYKKAADYETRKDEQGEYKIKETRAQLEGRKEYEQKHATAGGSNPNLIADLCRSMKTKGSVHYGKTAEEVLDFAQYKQGTALYEKHKVTLRACEQKGDVTKIDAIATESKPPSQDCPCRDKDGKEIPGKFAQKDEKGDCKPCLEECTCTKSDGSTYTVGKDANGNCEKCSEEITEDGSEMSVETPPVREAEWWLQDTVNAAGAFGDLMGVRKRMPWEARVDLEEPRPTFLDPTRELAAQSEQANIAAQASAQFAGPQALGSRLSAIQGKGAAAAADTLSRINNQNVGIANQFEGQQVGIRNQEQLMNQQMANRVYDKNVIADQQFQNAKRAGRANMAQAYNTAVTNKWKTDALNQMYPDYQVSPSSGGRVYAAPGAKDPTATKPEMTMEEYIEANKGMDKDLLREAVKIKYGKRFGGGTTFRDGGFIYTVFPAISL
jgi:hypothetical protein